jgi:hypothetical protein
LLMRDGSFSDDVHGWSPVLAPHVAGQRVCRASL